MGRLIDADKLLETLQDLEPHCDNKDYERGMLSTMNYYMPRIINDEPTAYDVDKVVEQLEELKSLVPVNRILDDIVNEKPKELGMLIAYSKAIEIVKGGGIDAESRIKAVPILWETN